MIRRLLVANRGEIARRILSTCRLIGIETVAVFSDADARSPHVAEADYGLRLPGNSPAATYLRGDLIIAAARQAGADAVHPGYGFLSENADFATAVGDAGLTWVGPPAKVIGVMGAKVEAKDLLADAGVPMLPSWTDPERVNGFPVLVKASAGGGGRGMRIVRDRDTLAEAMASARREAASAFGDGTVFMERYVERARHIEVQIVADAQGAVVPFGERECSVQRRHQKIIEETPSPAVTPQLREKLCAAAVTAARAVGYVGVGTVEFLVDADTGAFFFLEMNTRLQVEHAVTELVTGFDLVRLQLLIAEGGTLPFAGTPPVRGHAVEVRVCAEDPTSDWLPSAGTLHRFHIPQVAGEFTPLAEPGLRLDSGVRDGSVVGVHYDSMLAKVIAWGPTRPEALRLLAGALARSELHGVVTNRDLLVRVLRHPSFRQGSIDTAFLDRHPEVFTPLLSAGALRVSCLAAALAGASARRSAATVLRSLPSGWRNVPSRPQTTVYDGPAGAVEVGYRLDRSGDLANSWVRAVAPEEPDGHGPGQPPVTGDHPPAAVVSATGDRVTLEVNGIRRTLHVHRVGAVSYVDGPDGSVALTELPRFPLPRPVLAEGSLVAPLPGQVSRVMVDTGQRVRAGELLMTLEAMKLEHPVYAPSSGVVTSLPVTAGAQVDTGAVLAVLTPE